MPSWPRASAVLSGHGRLRNAKISVEDAPPRPYFGINPPVEFLESPESLEPSLILAEAI